MISLPPPHFVRLFVRFRIWESDDLQPESDGKQWDELTSAERKAALLLGYCKKSWNGDGDSEEEGGNNTSDALSSDGSEDWAGLSNEARNAAKVLGYTQAIWDNDGSPPTEDMDWDELSPKEQEAAKTLGYTKERWEGEDDDESNAAASYNTPRPSEGSASVHETSRGSSSGSVIEKIIASCSFDSNNDNSEASKSSIASVTGISSGITSLLGFSKSEETSENATH